MTSSAPWLDPVRTSGRRASGTRLTRKLNGESKTQNKQSPLRVLPTNSYVCDAIDFPRAGGRSLVSYFEPEDAELWRNQIIH